LQILVAEDIVLNQVLIRHMLEGLGHLVTIVADGAAAVAAVEREPFDIVLMDVQMPGMNGLEAARSIRALAGSAGRVPIVALTAGVLNQEQERCREAGMDAVMTKPVTLTILAAAILRWAGSGRVAGTGDAVR
jgi:CheY-like chemotaxis protein